MGVVAALQFVTLAVLARILSPSDFGLMGMTMVVIGFAQAFTDMGVSNAIIYKQEISIEALSSLYWLNVIAGITVFCIVSLSTPIIVTLYREPRLSSLMYLAAVIYLITPFGQQFQIIMQKELLFKQLTTIDIIGSSTNATVSIILAFEGMGVFSLIWGQILSASIRVLLLSYWGWNKWRPRLYFSKQDMKGFISFGLYQMGEKAVNYFNGNLDSLLIGSLLGAKALGYYSLAINLVIRPSSMVNPVITRVAFPVFSRIQNNEDKLKKGYIKVLELLSLVNFPIMACLAVVAPIAVPIIFGNQWLPSIMLIQVLAVAGLLRSTVNPVGALLLSKGRADLGFKWNLALMFTQIPGIYIGAKFGGTFGVAIAATVLMCLYTVFSYLILIRTLLSPCLRQYIASMWPSLWMSAVMAVAVMISGIFLQNIPRQFTLIGQLLCGAVVYLSMVVCSEKSLLGEIKSIMQGNTL